MQIQTDLKPMFSYSFPIILITIILTILLLLIIKHKRKTIPIIPIAPPNNKDLNTIKNNYLNKIDLLTKEYNEGKITTRKSYQILSNIIRNFVYETTNIKVQNYTLKEIETLNIPILSELIKEYYHPEFAKISNGNINNSIDKTRTVIQKWY